MRFLSTDWLTQVRNALADDATFAEAAKDASFRMSIVAEDAPAWAGDLTIVLEAGRIELEEGSTGKPDAVGKAAYADWLAILRHELHPRDAVLTGKLRGSGPLTVLRHYRVIDTALDVLRTVPCDE